MFMFPGYLSEEQLMTAYDEFLEASPYLDAFRNEYDRIFMTSLKSVLAEYRAVKIYGWYLCNLKNGGKSRSSYMSLAEFVNNFHKSNIHSSPFFSGNLQTTCTKEAFVWLYQSVGSSEVLNTECGCQQNLCTRCNL